MMVRVGLLVCFSAGVIYGQSIIKKAYRLALGINPLKTKLSYIQLVKVH